MSAYRIIFYANTPYVGCDLEEEYDLVEGYGYTEEEAKEIIKNESKLQELFEEWFSENIEAGFQVLVEREEECNTEN